MELRGVDHPVGRLNGQRLDAGEKRGAVIAARPNVEGLIGCALKTDRQDCLRRGRGFPTVSESTGANRTDTASVG